MRYAFLVAWREYAENAKTKGFWIGIFIFPILIWASMTVGGLLEKTKPVRHFVLVDQSHAFESAVQTGLDRLAAKASMKALGEYLGKNARGAEVDLEQVPADLQGQVQKFADDNPELVDAFLRAGGTAVALEQMRPYLRPDAPEFHEPKRPFRRVELPAGIRADAPPAEISDALKPYLRGDASIEVDGQPAELFAAVLLPADITAHAVRPGKTPELGGASGIQYWSANLADEDLKDAIEQAVDEEFRRTEYVARGMDVAGVTEVQRTHLPLVALDPKKAAGEETVSVADTIRQWAPVGFVYLLWIGIFSIVQMLLNNTIEEKSNRVIEVLLSSVTPGELMMGKLAGIAAVGLTMVGAWVGSLFVVLQLKSGPEAEFPGQLLHVLRTSGLLPAFVVYFLLGYLLYAGAFLAIGSVCNTLKEAQNMMGPIMLVMIVPLLTMAFIPKDPNGTLATILSWIPPYTPFVMMNRASADPPLVDRIGTLVLLAATTVVVLALCGRIFRVGVLRTGQPPKLKELLRWVRKQG